MATSTKNKIKQAAARLHTAFHPESNAHVQILNRVTDLRITHQSTCTVYLCLFQPNQFRHKLLRLLQGTPFNKN